MRRTKITLRLGTFRLAVCCTLALFAIAATIPNDALALAAWFVAMFLGVPAGILYRTRATGSAPLTRRLTPAFRAVLLRSLGGFSLLVGLWLLSWRAYLDIIRREPGFDGLTTMAHILLAAVLLASAFSLLIPSSDPVEQLGR